MDGVAAAAPKENPSVAGAALGVVLDAPKLKPGAGAGVGAEFVVLPLTGAATAGAAVLAPKEKVGAEEGAFLSSLEELGVGAAVETAEANPPPKDTLDAAGGAGALPPKLKAGFAEASPAGAAPKMFPLPAGAGAAPSSDFAPNDPKELLALLDEP